MLTELWKHDNPDHDRETGSEGPAGPFPRSTGAPVTCETSYWNRWDATTAPCMERIRYRPPAPGAGWAAPGTAKAAPILPGRPLSC